MKNTYIQSDAICGALGLSYNRTENVSDKALNTIPLDAKRVGWGGYNPLWSPPIGGRQGEYTKERADKAIATRRKNGTMGGWHYKSGHNDETKKLLSIRAKEVGTFANGRNPNRLMVECPHCGKTGAKPGLKRWHFDNCKGKV